MSPDGYQDVGIAIIDAVLAAGNDYDAVIRPIMGRIMTTYSHVVVKDAKWLLKEFSTIAPAALSPSQRGDRLVNAVLETARPMLMGRKGTRPRGLVIEDIARSLMSYQSMHVPHGLGNFVDWAPVRALTGVVRKTELRNIYTHVSQVDGMGEATSRYLAILLGCAEVKPDIHTRWFFEQHSGATSTHLDKCVGDELVNSAERLIASGATNNPVGWIDHLMWRQKSKHVTCSDGNAC
ncbi:MAG: hypothetical protein WCG62_06185 [Actinomycetes bacterium]